MVKKSIVILSSEFPPLPGGIGNHAFNLAEQLQLNGYAVSVITDQRDTLKNEQVFDKNLKFKVYRIVKTKFRFLMYFKRIKTCYTLIKSSNVLICSGKFSLWVGALFGVISKVNTIAVIHGSEVNFSNLVLKKSIDYSLKKFHKIIAVSNYTKHLVAHLNLNDIKVIPNGHKPMPLSSKSKNAHKKNGYPSLLTVGNLTSRKGQQNVISYLPKLKETYPNVHYHCIGLPTEINTFRALAKKLKVEDNVTFHGYLNEDALSWFYSNSDVFVMLSTTTKSGDVEGFGIAFLEANNFGLPTIGSLGCGIEDAISNEKSGILVNAESAEQFGDAIKTILSDNEAFKTGAKKWAKAHQWKNIISTYINFIEA